MAQQFYSDDDAEAILKLASRKSGDQMMSRDRLFETAAELGITPQAVEEAERNYREEQVDREDLIRFQKHKKGEFLGHLGSFVCSCLGLGALDFFTNNHHFAWVYWVAIFWGIGVVRAFQEAFLQGPLEREKSFRKWQRKQTRRNLIASGSRGIEMPPVLIPDEDDSESYRVRHGMRVGLHVGNRGRRD